MDRPRPRTRATHRPARFKRPAVRRARRQRSAAAVTASLLALIIVPAVAFGAAGDLVKGVLGGAGGAVSGPVSQAGVPGTGTGYQPPLHTDDPHGQGSVATVDVGPSQALPLPNNDPATGDEDIVVGDSRGEYSNGAYHGRVTILRALVPLIGANIDISFKTEEGQTNNGPLGPLQTALDQVCTQTTVCLTLLAVNSSTTSSGSQNSFETAGATVGPPGTASASVLSSKGDISDNGSCQTATGESNWADVDALGVVTADVLQGSSSSTACQDGSKSQTNNSTLLNVLGLGVPILPAGCNNGTPDTEVVPPAPIDQIIVLACHADDSSGAGEAVTQASNPYGVREALTAFLLGGLIKITLSGPESHAVPPPDTGTAGQVGGPDDAPGNPGAPGAGSNPGPVAGEAGAGGDTLPFTGSNVLLLALIGIGLVAFGLGASTLSRHRGPAQQL
jgi:hypothetical protein